MPKRGGLGTVKICIDGTTNCNTVNLAAGALGARRLVFVRNNLSPAVNHTVVVTRTGGTVELDALVVVG